MVCFRYIIVNTLHTGDDKNGGDDDDDDDNNNNNNNTVSMGPLLTPYRAQELYRRENLHQPRHPVPAAVFRDAIKDTSCR
jgi:hypothetical protein